MRHHRPRYDERIAKTLAEHGVLGFSTLMTASGINSSEAVSRGLRKLRREGRVDRTVLPTYPPRVLYRLVDPSEAKPAE
jgi:DNA-binding HxlR family transcriptional regulator